MKCKECRTPMIHEDDDSWIECPKCGSGQSCEKSDCAICLILIGKNEAFLAKQAEINEQSLNPDALDPSLDPGDDPKQYGY